MRRFPSPYHRRRQQGFSAMLVLAIVVTMGSLIAYAVTLTSSLQAGLAQEISSARALQAAKTGVEWARYRILQNAANCAAFTDFTIPLNSGAHPVTVTCTVTSPAGGYVDGGPAITTYQLTSTACNPAPSGRCPDATTLSNYVQRQVTGIAER